ncbi:MAG TPA: nuclear transport factor 2 family protein [Acidimicrobiales bacterium]
MDRSDVARWVAAYERAWRTPGTAGLGGLFSDDVRYLPSPWAPAIQGLDALAAFWEDERTGPDESFDLASEVVAVDGAVAVVRVSVEYAADQPSRWRDLWVVTFAPDDRCRAFEEWPFAGPRRRGHRVAG